MGEASEFTWPGGENAAMSLTFDGGLPEHLELVIPALDEHGFKGTFFVTMPALLENPAGWKKAAEAGHEIGSHSLLYATQGGALEAWTLDMFRDDLRMTEKGIAEICEVPVSSFALPGESTECSEGDYHPVLAKFYTSIRAFEPLENEGVATDLTRIGSLRWENLVGQIESYLPKPGHWNVVVFEKFFDAGAMAAEDDLRFLLAHLSKKKDIWTAPMSKISEWINASRTRPPVKT